MEQRIFTTGQIAKYCGVDYQTVIRWADRGEIKAFKLPGRGDHRIKLEDFLEFLNKHDMPIPPELAPPSNRVLIVEDQLHIAQSIQKTLRTLGFETKIADNSFEAGVMLGIFMPNMIILDLELSELDVPGILGFIHNNDKLKNISVLAISENGREELESLLAAGVDSVIAKPFSQQELTAKVSTLIGSQTARV